MCTGLGGDGCPVDVLSALGVQVEGRDGAKAKLTEPKKAEKSQWRGGHHSPAACGACGELAGRPSVGMLGMERGSTSPHLLPAHSLPPGRVYTPRHTQSLGHRLWMSAEELLAASCEVQLLPFSRHWIFPSLEDQGKIDPGSRAGGSFAHSTYSSKFPRSSALVGPDEIFAKILRKSWEFCSPGFAKTFLLIKQPKEMRRFSLTLRVGSALNFKKGFANAILQNTHVPSSALLKDKF